MYIKLYFDAIHVKRDKICGFTILHIHFVFIIRCGRLNAKKVVSDLFFWSKTCPEGKFLYMFRFVLESENFLQSAQFLKIMFLDLLIRICV